MAAFRILNQFPVYFNSDGTVASGGYMVFYETGTTTPKDVYSDKALTVSLGSTVAIESDGRTATELWGDGEYRVRFYTASDVLVAEADDVEIPGGDAATIPALVAGQYLTNNGAVMLWAAVKQVPDMTGQTGKLLGNNGTTALWQSIAEQSATSSSTEFRIGNLMAQFGSGSAAANGTRNVGDTVSYATTFDSPAKVFIQMEGGGVTASGSLPTAIITSSVAGGFSVQFNVAGAIGSPDDLNIINAVDYWYLAIGTKAV